MIIHLDDGKNKRTNVVLCSILKSRDWTTLSEYFSIWIIACGIAAYCSGDRMCEANELCLLEMYDIIFS